LGGGGKGALPLPYDWIVYSVYNSDNNSFTIYALNCHTGKIDVSDSDWGTLISAVAVLASASVKGQGTAFHQIGYYPASTQATLLGSLNLVGVGGLTGITIVDYSAANPTLATAILGVTNLEGIQFDFGSNQTLGIDATSGGFIKDVEANGAATADIKVAGVFAFGLTAGICEIINGGNGNVLHIGIANSTVIDSQAFANFVEGNLGTVVDNSGKINYVHNLELYGFQAAPHAPDTNPVVNNLGTRVEVVISIGVTPTTVTKNATVVATGVSAQTFSLTLNEGESITFDQTTNVSWQWFAL
jgi:hypothetical protein